MIKPTFSIFGATFHWYGLLIAIGGVLAFSLIEKQAKKYKLSSSRLNQMSIYAIVGGIIGARLWHAMTDWHLYADNFDQILAIWKGGLSIFGAVAGGLLALAIYSRKSLLSFWKMSDILIFGLPLGQVIGRLGNWLNGELYGLPTNLPWKIFVAPENRLPGFESAAFYHPLFFYEIILLAIFLGVVWVRERQQENYWRVGTGRLSLLYIGFYSFIRLGLDFLRLDKANFAGTDFGVNQVICVVIIFTVIIFWKSKYRKL